MNINRNTDRLGQSGFTLIEVMVVVVILGILAAVIVPKLVDKPEQARQVKAQQDIRTLEGQLQMYKLDNFYYPSTQQGLEALVSKPSGDPPPKNWRQYIPRLPKDPWNNAYQYMQPGTKGGDYDVFTMGADGKPGGEGADADIGNWNIEG